MDLQTGMLTVGWYINKNSSVFRELRYFETPVKFHIGVLSHSVVSNSLWPHGLKSTGLLYPWGFSRQEYWSGLPWLYPNWYHPVVILVTTEVTADWTSFGSWWHLSACYPGTGTRTWGPPPWSSLVSILLVSSRGESPGRQLPGGYYVWNRGERVMQDGPGRSWGHETRLTSEMSGSLLENHLLFSGGGSDNFYLNSLISSFIYPNKFFSQIKIMKCGGHIRRLGITWM